jgi:long-subunit acyl-CoA synthetase (AMP-forming)
MPDFVEDAVTLPEAKTRYGVPSIGNEEGVTAPDYNALRSACNDLRTALLAARTAETATESAVAIVASASPYALTSAHGLSVNATAGAVTVNLHAASAAAGRTHFIVKTDASANAVTINRAGSDTIQGATSVVLTAQWDKVSLWSDGTATWFKTDSVVTP